jgi:hypothetical protein
MRRLLALTLLLFACSSGGSGSNDGGAGSGGSGGGGGSGGTGSGPKNCQQIQLCAIEASCGDEACLTSCKQGATSEAQTAFDALEECTRTMGGCARGNADFWNCMCLAQCLQDPPCTTELDACLGTTPSDSVCAICH